VHDSDAKPAARISARLLWIHNIIAGNHPVFKKIGEPFPGKMGGRKGPCRSKRKGPCRSWILRQWKPSVFRLTVRVDNFADIPLSSEKETTLKVLHKNGSSHGQNQDLTVICVTNLLDKEVLVVELCPNRGGRSTNQGGRLTNRGGRSIGQMGKGERRGPCSEA